MSATTEAARTTAPDPRRYFEQIADDRGRLAEQEPVCLYLEVTNRCNLLCETCPRTFEELEPPGDMSWELFTSIIDQIPNISRVVLHGVGEPMMVRNLPRMVRYLKDRGTYVLFNTNGTLLNEKKGRELAEAGLDELRVSLDAADAPTFKLVRGKDFFGRIVRNVRAFAEMQQREGLTRPRLSLWLTGLKETIDQLPDFVRLSHSMGVMEVHLQRLTFLPEGQGLAREQSALFEQLDENEIARIREAEAVAAELGMSFDGSGATEPGTSVRRAADDKPWSLCRRPWSLMYFTAHGRAIPCCIAPFSMRGYDAFTLGDATKESLRAIWNGPRYQDFRAALLGDVPPPVCASCGLRWSL
jgi:MoaA/NifB/PqqE/SkfB family radical SAM enzyme